ncbi:hypothetical protein GO988_11745 [Hymenobacter sp. HMF4947]|uniref:Uncharacterized protein n=1 Tax=Hymenobacter ginkgonis TaxID=2682976 RepID=A0A7K1TF12_9BACT|nr:hypothetical protein [Hymenobacter ginkgonis]MVN76999.1 hypothetical protein [Hymenobacter ginkgonis]
MARPHPYHFAYTMLPQLVWRRPAAVRRELNDPLLARELLLYIWDKAAESLPPRERVAPRGLHLSWHTVAGRATALLQLPAPQATGEAHLAAIVYEHADDPDDQSRIPDDDEPDEDDPVLADEALPRYFLLEATLGRSPDEAGTPTMLGELRGEHHRHHAPGPPAGRPDTTGRFLQALADLLGPLPTEVPYMRIVRG